VILQGERRGKNPGAADAVEAGERAFAVDAGPGGTEDEFGGQVVGEVIGDVEFGDNRVAIGEIRAGDTVDRAFVIGNDAKPAHADLPRADSADVLGTRGGLDCGHQVRRAGRLGEQQNCSGCGKSADPPCASGGHGVSP